MLVQLESDRASVPDVDWRELYVGRVVDSDSQYSVVYGSECCSRLTNRLSIDPPTSKQEFVFHVAIHFNLFVPASRHNMHVAEMPVALVVDRLQSITILCDNSR
jgi:hypothetical protein